MAKMIIEREYGYMGMMRGIVIQVDGKRCAKVRLNTRVEFQIAPGVHSVQARMDWVKSMPIQVTVKDGDVIGFTCRASGNASTHQISLHKVSHTSEATRDGQGRSEKADRHEQTELRGGDQLAPWNIVLEVSVDASVEEIRAAYLRRISEYHPDKVASLGREIREVAERRSKEINAAYSFAMEQRRKR